MFKFLEKINKSEQKEVKEAIQESAPEPEIQADPEAEKEAFKQSIDEVNEYLKNNDGHIDPETIEMITGKSIDEVFESLADQKLELNLEQLKSSISQTIDDIDNKPSVLEFFRKQFKKPAAKASFVALMLFLKFAPDLQAMEKGDEVKDKVEDKTEVVKENKIDDGNTYQLGADDFEGDKLDSDIDFEDFERYSHLDMSNYFDTDKADISQENRTEIVESFTNFLSTINSDNFAEVKTTDFKVLGSSDERPTNNWEDGNLGLTKARIQVATELLNEVLDNYDFSGSDLSEEQIEQLKNKEFKNEIPDNGGEKGVTKISDLINPDTNENYTNQEIEDIKNNDVEKYENLLAQCRYVKAEFLSVKAADDLEKMPTINDDFKVKAIEKLEPRNNPLINFNDYEGVTLAVDNSGSMNASYEVLAKFIAQQEPLQDTKLNFKTFSNTADQEEIKVNDLNEVVDLVKNMDKDGNSQERALSSAIEILDNLEKANGNERNLVVMATDEAIQHLSYEEIEQLKAKAQEKNAEVIFVLAHERGSGTQEIIKISDLENAYFNHFWEDLNKVAQRKISQQEARLGALENSLERSVKTLEYETQRLERGEDKKSAKETEQKVADRNSKIEDYKSQIDRAKLVVESLKSAQESGNPEALTNALKDLGYDYSSRLFQVNGGVGQQFATVE